MKKPHRGVPVMERLAAISLVSGQADGHVLTSRAKTGTGKDIGRPCAGCGRRARQQKKIVPIAQRLRVFIDLSKRLFGPRSGLTYPADTSLVVARDRS
jgi:hypothetical protein